MKIVGGSFGVDGAAYITGASDIAILGAREAIYPASAIRSIAARVESERKFGVIGFILSVIILSVMLGLVLGVLGVVIAVVVAIAGSFYSKKRHVVDISFTDGNSLSLECSKGAANRLSALRA